MKKYAVFIFVFTFLTIFLSMAFKNSITEFSLKTLSPIKSAVSGCGSRVYNFFNKDNLIRENEALSKELSNYRKKTAENELLKKENEELKASLSLKKSPSLEVKAYATVCDILTQGDFLITIDKGKNQNVSYGDVAVWGGALFGRVCEVFDNYSQIKPVTAPDTITGASTSGKNTGLILGKLGAYKSNLCEFSPFSEDIVVTKGEQIVTSGLSDIYPEGLIIGTIEDIAETITVKTEVDFFSARTLAIVSPSR